MELGDLVLWLEILTDIAAVNLIEEVSVQSMVIQVTALRQQIAYQARLDWLRHCRRAGAAKERMASIVKHSIAKPLFRSV